MATAVETCISIHQHQWHELPAFKAKAFAHLALHARVNTLLFSALNNLCVSKQPIEAALMATVETSNGAVEAVLVSTGPLGPKHQVKVSHGLSKGAAEQISKELLLYGPYTQICGSAQSMSMLLDALAGLSLVAPWQIQMRINLLALIELQQPSRPVVTGATLMQCDPITDEALVLDWIPQFMADVWHSPPPPRASVAEYIAPMLQAGNVYKYVLPEQEASDTAADGADGSTAVPVALVACNATSPGAVRITALYTPPQQRNKGSGAHTVAALCRHLQEQGIEDICICADEASPVANKIYQAIGFRHVADLHTAARTPRDASLAEGADVNLLCVLCVA